MSGGGYDDFDRMLLRAGRKARAPTTLRKNALAAAAAGTLAAGAKAAGASALKATTLETSRGLLGKSALAAVRASMFKWAVVASLGAASVGTYVVETRKREAPAVTEQQAFSPSPLAGTSMDLSGERNAAPLPSAVAPRGARTGEPGPLVDPRSGPGEPDIAPSRPFATAIATPTRSAGVSDAVRANAAGIGETGTPVPARAKASDATPTTPDGDAPTAAASSASSTGRTSLEEEIRLVESARRALAQRDPALALRFVEEHELRHPSGSFAAERDALRVDALVAAGRTSEAAARARLFLVRHGNSAQAPRMARISGEVKIP